MLAMLHVKKIIWKKALVRARNIVPSGKNTEEALNLFITETSQIERRLLMANKFYVYLANGSVISGARKV